MKTRSIEMYVGKAYGGGDSGSWYTTYVEIPIDTAEEDIEEISKEILINKLRNEGDGNVAFVGLYNIPEEDIDEDYGI